MKKTIIRNVFYLKNREYITPNFIRITLEGDKISEYKDCTVGINNKIFIPPAGVDKVYFPEFDAEKMTLIPVAENLAPSIRTYTYRGIDLNKQEMYIDFVAHGDEGPASNWAINAAIGSELGVGMKAGARSLYPKADWYMLVGDATAIPVLFSILEDLPVEAKGYAIVEVISKEEIQEVKTKSQVKVEWVINPTLGRNSQLVSIVKNYIEQNKETSKFAYIATEFSTVKELRTYLRKEKEWTIDELDAYSYWRYGKSETNSESDRRAELMEKYID